MNKDYKILECLEIIKNVCEQQIIDSANDYPYCNDCPFFSFRAGECLIREKNPCKWDLNIDNEVIWRALL